MTNEYIEQTLRINTSRLMDKNVTLDDSIEKIKERLLVRSSDSENLDNDWDQGYSQCMIDIYQLLNGVVIWEN